MLFDTYQKKLNADESLVELIDLLSRHCQTVLNVNVILSQSCNNLKAAALQS